MAETLHIFLQLGIVQCWDCFGITRCDLVQSQGFLKLEKAGEVPWEDMLLLALQVNGWGYEPGRL